MAEQQRPAPEELLKRIEREERGKLTVFLGAAAGVGKTYAMLEAAQERLAEGADVVIGWVETHKRRETEALLEGLNRLPARQLEYQGRVFDEMDVDALIKRRPEIALVDELAHTNIPGARHERRFQDVEELLKVGIDVYTTLNIQHIESLNDVVVQITEIPVRETVPDRILEDADQIRMIDISPDELIRRLEEGKVYVPEQARHAIRKFFRPGNINALRELALRYAALGVDKQLERYREAHAIVRPWAARELVMAAVGPSPFSAQVIRSARRLATALKTNWITAFVEDPSHKGLSPEAREQLARNLRLAEELGAEIIGLTGSDLPAELLQLARRRNVTAIVIGKPIKPRVGMFWRPSVVEKVMQGSQGISVHVIPGVPLGGAPARKQFLLKGFDAKPYLSALLVVAAMTVVMAVLRPYSTSFFDAANVALLFLLPVLMAALRWGRGPSIFAAFTATLSFLVFFVPPELRFTVADLRYLLILVVFLAVAIITGNLASRLRNQAEIARRREARASALYTLSRQIAAESDLHSIMKRAAEAVGNSIQGDAVIYVADTSGGLTPQAVTPGTRILLEQKERAVAEWVFESGELAGKGTTTLSGSAGLYLPLIAEKRKNGVLGVLPRKPEQRLAPEQRRLLEAFAGFASLAIARQQLAEEAREAGYTAESERLRTALFSSVSHDLRTPLAAIDGAVTSLQDEGAYGAQERRAFVKTIRDGALHIDHLVGNLLDTARLESGMLELKKDWCDMRDIIGAALRRVQEVKGKRQLNVNIPKQVPLIRADFSLIEQVLVNLLYNAIGYSPPESEISIAIDVTVDKMLVLVGDRGPGIAVEDRTRIFDKFYRLYAPEHVTGTGLGLAICKGFVEAHGGRIWVEPNPGGGSLFIFSLPLERQPVVHAPEEV